MIHIVSKYFSSISKHGTTILAVNKDNRTVLIGDGQITQGSQIIKSSANKLRTLAPEVVTGFAGSLADCLTLLDELDILIKKYEGFPLLKPCVALTQLWRTEKKYQKLEASILVCSNKNEIIELDGVGNILTFEGVRSIGSGSVFAESAALALLDIPGLSAMDIANKAMKIAADKCCYTSNQFKILELNCDNTKPENEDRITTIKQS